MGCTNTKHITALESRLADETTRRKTVEALLVDTRNQNGTQGKVVDDLRQRIDAAVRALEDVARRVDQQTILPMGDAAVRTELAAHKQDLDTTMSTLNRLQEQLDFVEERVHGSETTEIVLGLQRHIRTIEERVASATLPEPVPGAPAPAYAPLTTTVSDVDSKEVAQLRSRVSELEGKLADADEMRNALVVMQSQIGALVQGKDVPAPAPAVSPEAPRRERTVHDEQPDSTKIESATDTAEGANGDALAKALAKMLPAEANEESRETRQESPEGLGDAEPVEIPLPSTDTESQKETDAANSVVIHDDGVSGVLATTLSQNVSVPTPPPQPAVASPDDSFSNPFEAEGSIIRADADGAMDEAAPFNQAQTANNISEDSPIDNPVDIPTVPTPINVDDAGAVTARVVSPDIVGSVADEIRQEAVQQIEQTVEAPIHGGVVASQQPDAPQLSARSQSSAVINVDEEEPSP